MNRGDHVLIVGAGLVGSLLSILLKKEGYRVSVYEKREDPRKWVLDSGRSINLALSHRGIRSLKLAGVFDQVKELLIPMHGRMMHDLNGHLTAQAYGLEGQYINSVSRAELNKVLVQAADQAGVAFYFNRPCTSVDLDSTSLRFESEMEDVKGDWLIGADGAFSRVRDAMMRTDRFDYQQFYIDYGYKELTMPSQNGAHVMDANHLHIWPRGKFMLIALPNTDGSFTTTLFFPFEGLVSFDQVDTSSEMAAFFDTHFADAVPLLPHLREEFEEHPLSSLVTIKCYPWTRNRSLVIGDACHAIVPFYGQGMNAGFEDCRIWMETLDEFDHDWAQALNAFQERRKPDADAIADLALKNFMEMRDWVADERFLLRKKIEARLHELYPERWIPQYSMVTFSDIPYAEAQRLGEQQDRWMQEVLSELSEEELKNPNLDVVLQKLSGL